MAHWYTLGYLKEGIVMGNNRYIDQNVDLQLDSLQFRITS